MSARTPVRSDAAEAGAAGGQGGGQAMSGNGTGAVAAPGLLPPTQDTGRAAAGRGAAHGPPAEASVDDLEGLAKKLVARLGPRRVRFLASLLDEQADEAEGGR
jgi:hypothetical protein